VDVLLNTVQLCYADTKAHYYEVLIGLKNAMVFITDPDLDGKICRV